MADENEPSDDLPSREVLVEQFEWRLGGANIVD